MDAMPRSPGFVSWFAISDNANLGPRRRGHTTVPSLLILGTDAVLAAQPATPVQLVHACRAAGFDVVVPASWGDEIIAHGVLHHTRDARGPLVQCSCPLVARRLADHESSLPRVLLPFVPPPVAAARYLRSVYRDSPLHVTYAGDCPFAPTDDIDAQLSCSALLERLTAKGVSPLHQPTEFDSVLPPDRRRHFSEAGGIPSRESLRKVAHGLELVELTEGDMVVELDQHQLEDRPVMIDVAASLGCHCAGSIDGVSASEARARVRAHEPPRSQAPVVDHDVRIRVEPDVVRPAVAERAPPALFDIAAPLASAPDADTEPVLIGAELPARRRSPVGISRAVLGAMPLSRSEKGRQLPRMYVARRRSSPRGLRESVIRREAPSATPVRRTPSWIVITALGILAGAALTFLLAR